VSGRSNLPQVFCSGFSAAPTPTSENALVTKTEGVLRGYPAREGEGGR
jgi:hypothetical protein